MQVYCMVPTTRVASIGGVAVSSEHVDIRGRRSK